MFFFSPKKSRPDDFSADIASAGGIGLWEWNPGTGEFWFSDYAQKLLQLGNVKPTLVNVQKNIFLDDRGKFLQAFTDTFQTEPVLMVIRIQTQPEYYRWIRWHGAWHEKDDHRYLRGTLQDVHEERLTQLELEFTQEMLSEAQRIARIGSWQYDLVSKHLFWSEESFNIFGRDMSLGAPQHKNQYRYFDPAAAELLRARAKDAVNLSRPYEIDVRAIRDDGREITVRIIGRPLFDKGGNPYLLIGTVQDITDWVDLKTAKAQTEQNQKAQSQFLASVSHEIRTPMNAIFGMVQLLLRADLPKRQAEQAKVILSAATDLLALINDLLDMAKLESGHLTLETIAFDLPENLREITVLHGGKIYGKNLEFIVDVDPRLPRRVEGDPLRLKQVIGNLLSNAAKFTKEGHITLRVSVEGHAGPNVIIRFSVEDTGIGIPPHRLSSVFEKYVQAEISTAREYGGTGLGLSICQELVQMMGSEIQVTSDGGLGTRFWFDIPLLPLPAELDPPLEARVLVLEPSDISAQNLQPILKQLGCSVDIVTSPQLLLSALNAARAEQKYSHVIISDHPKYDSNAVGASVRALAGMGAIKLVLLTLPITQTLSNDVFDAILLRPVFAHDLRRALKVAGDRPVLAHNLPGENHPRILLAEDNHATQHAFSSMLEGFGYSPQIVNHGEAAVAAASQRQFSAILLDIQMPVMDGLNAARLIREAENKHNRPPQIILGLADSVSEAQRAACLAAGMNGILTKSITADELQKALQPYIRRAPTG